ncbi:MAG TPA: NAD-binding protein [Streptosporangiaceae bacterium]|jgi:Trk K+ transport system NAD-binding subunit|nr:NAD-binding protein [Streptosporangiaceae bacterium]
MPAQPRRADRRGGHLIVCGDGPLSYRITEELTARYGEHVTVILPDRRNHHGPQISALPRVRVLEYPELSSQAFTDADVQSARALAVVWQDDVGNLHAGLRAQELNPGLRLVLAIFNGRLGDHIRMLFPDCTVLSGTAMSAPSFVAAALDQPAPSHVRVQRRTLYVARPHDVAPGAVVCGLTDDHDDPRLLPPGEALRDQAGLVLAVADGTPRNPLARSPNPARALAGLLRRLVWHKFGLVFTALLAVIGIGLALLATVYSLSDAFYLTLMDLTGSALTRSQDTAAEKVAQVMLTVDGMAFIPVITAIVVGARLTGSVRRAPRPASGHIIVVGLGNVGTAVTGQLHDLGFEVVCVDNNPNAPGIPMARQMGLPVVIGDAFREQTLRAAHLDTCLALVSVTSLDIVNLETALNARALRDDLRIVLRLTDDDLAERLEKTTGNTISRSVPYLAAPAFATAMLEHQVLRTIDVGRHVLLIAEIRVADQAGLAGSRISDTEQDGQARVLALQASGVAVLDWSPQRGYLLAAGDRLIVLATRRGLGRFLSVH